APRRTGRRRRDGRDGPRARRVREGSGARAGHRRRPRRRAVRRRHGRAAGARPRRRGAHGRGLAGRRDGGLVPDVLDLDRPPRPVAGGPVRAPARAPAGHRPRSALRARGRLRRARLPPPGVVGARLERPGPGRVPLDRGAGAGRVDHLAARRRGPGPARGRHDGRADAAGPRRRYRRGV
ncbi:MAG: Histone acetyltransferase HPA2 and related acetyltransferases, partial [uncultured Quadrisphaera sp.]